MMPKGRYRLMTDYMGRVGTHGTQMMYRTCTVQVNLDFASEADMVKKLRVALALQPVATALFASFAVLRGQGERPQVVARRGSGATSTPSRTGMLPFVFEDGMGFSAMSTTCSMCRCTSSTATGATSTRSASPSAIS